jgi:stearoyl-CoA desaturase (delta-9 desaturase)
MNDRAHLPGLSSSWPFVLQKRVENTLLVGIPLTGTIFSLYWFSAHHLTWVACSVFAGMYLITGFGVGLGLHRYFSHGSFVANSVMASILGCAGSMAFQGSILRWVADHRRHHARTDRCGDVHSPYFDSHCAPTGTVVGLFHAHVGWMFDDVVTDYHTYAKDLLEDDVIMFFHRTHWLWPVVSLAVPFGFGYCISGMEEAWGCLLMGGCARATVLHNAIWAVNSIGHRFGAQTYSGRDNSRNNFILALLTFGEGWHNNHHRFPKSAIQGLRRGEVDISGMMVDLLEHLGLIRDVIRISPPRFAQPPAID